MCDKVNIKINDVNDRGTTYALRPGGKLGARLMLARLKSLWRAVRRLSGDDAYERYLAHQAEHHPQEAAQSKQEFFKEWQDSKWKGVKRCC